METKTETDTDTETETQIGWNLEGFNHTVAHWLAGIQLYHREEVRLEYRTWSN